MSDFTFNTTPSIRQIAGGAAQLGEIVAGLPQVDGGAAVLFVTDPGIMKLGLAEGALNSLRQAGFTVTLFDGIEPDPKAATVEQVTALAIDAGVSCVVGFGGGSSGFGGGGFGGGGFGGGGGSFGGGGASGGW